MSDILNAQEDTQEQTMQNMQEQMKATSQENLSQVEHGTQNQTQPTYPEENKTPSKGKFKLNSQAKSIMLAMFSGLCFIGAIACFILIFVL